MATIPSLTTQVTGAVAGAAWANSVKDGIDFLIGTGSNVIPIAALSASAVQAIPTAAWTGLLMNTEELDSDGGHSTVTNTSRYTAQTAGWYLCNGTAAFAAAASSRRIVALRVDGTGTDSPTHGPNAAHGVSTNIALSTSALLYLAAGSWVEVVAYQDSGGSVNTTVTAGTQPLMSVIWQRS